MLAVEEDVPVLPAIAVPRRRWILRKAWDRMQFPKPFTRIDIHFGEPLFPEGRSQEELRSAVERALNALEREHDPDEAPPLASGGARSGRG